MHGFADKFYYGKLFQFHIAISFSKIDYKS